MSVKNNFNSIEYSYLKPFFKNSDVGKYYTNLSHEREVIYINKQRDNIEDLPNIKNHLNDFKSIIEKASDNAPYLHRPKNIDFENEKIVCPQRSKTNVFGYNFIPWYASADVYFITT